MDPASGVVGGSNVNNRKPDDDDEDSQPDRFIIVVQPENSAESQNESVVRTCDANGERLSTDLHYAVSYSTTQSCSTAQSYCTTDSSLSISSSEVSGAGSVTGITAMDITSPVINNANTNERTANTSQHAELGTTGLVQTGSVLSGEVTPSGQDYQQMLDMVRRQVESVGEVQQPPPVDQLQSTISVSQLNSILPTCTGAVDTSLIHAPNILSSSLQTNAGISSLNALPVSAGMTADNNAAAGNNSGQSTLLTDGSQSDNPLLPQMGQPLTLSFNPSQPNAQMIDNPAFTNNAVLQPHVPMLQGFPIQEQFLQQQHLYQPQQHYHQLNQQQPLDYQCSSVQQAFLSPMTPTGVNQPFRAFYGPSSTGSTYSAQLPLTSTSPAGSCGPFPTSSITPQPQGTPITPGSTYPGSGVMTYQPALGAGGTVVQTVGSGGGTMVQTVEGQAVQWSGTFVTQAADQHKQTSIQVQTAAAATVVNQQTIQNLITMQPPPQQQQQQHQQDPQQQLQQETCRADNTQNTNECSTAASPAAAAAYVHHQQQQQFVAWASAAVGGAPAAGLANPQLQYIQQPQQQIQLQQQQLMFQNMMMPGAVIQPGLINQSIISQQPQQQQQQQQHKLQQQQGQQNPGDYGNNKQQNNGNAAAGSHGSNSGAGNKGMATVIPQLQQQQQQQQTDNTVYAARQVMQQRQVTTTGPVMFGQIGMLQNGQQLQQQNQLRQGQQLAVNIGAIGGAQLFTAANGQQHIRFASTPNYITNTGQIIAAGNQTLLSMGQFQMPILQPTLLPNQATAFLGSQPLYIQAAPSSDNFNQQQQMAMIGNIQSVTPVKNIANIAPQTARASSAQPRRVQVLPNNSVSNSTATSLLSNTKQSTSRANSKVRPLAKTPPSVSAVSSARSAGSTSITTSANQKLPTVAVAPSLAKDRIVPTAVVVETSIASVANTNSTTAARSILSPPIITTTSVSTTNISTVSSAAPVCEVKSEKINTVTETTVSSDSSTQIKPFSTKLSTSTCAMKSCEADNVSLAESVSTVATISSDSMSATKTKPICGTIPSSGIPKYKAPQKKSRPKILTHIIEGFIIQEATEPFPVNRTTLMNQFLSSNVPLPAEASNKDSLDVLHFTDQDIDSDLEDNKGKFNIGGADPENCHESLAYDKETGQPSTAAPGGLDNAENAVQFYDDGIPRLICEFCGKLDVITNFARSRRFCSVTCSKRYSAYSQRKASTPGAGPAGLTTAAVSRPVTKRGGLSMSVGGSTVTQASTAQISHFSPVNKLPKTTLSTAIDPSTAHIASVSNLHTLTQSAGLVQRSVNSVLAETSVGGSIGASSLGGGASSSVAGAGGGSSVSQSPPQLERMELDDGEVSPPSNRPLAEWGVEEVYEFVRKLPGCETYAEEFRIQEIDGQALTLLKEDHLMMTLNVKLGPALKICQRINTLK